MVGGPALLPGAGRRGGQSAASSPKQAVLSAEGTAGPRLAGLAGGEATDAFAPAPSQAVTEEEVSRALVEGEEVTAPSRQHSANGPPELSYTLSAEDAAAEMPRDPLSLGEESRCGPRACPVLPRAAAPLGLDGVAGVCFWAGSQGPPAWGQPRGQEKAQSRELVRVWDQPSAGSGGLRAVGWWACRAPWAGGKPRGHGRGRPSLCVASGAPGTAGHVG